MCQAGPFSSILLATVMIIMTYGLLCLEKERPNLLLSCNIMLIVSDEKYADIFGSSKV